MNRRGFLLGVLSTPVVITTPNLLMPVKSFTTPVLYPFQEIMMKMALNSTYGHLNCRCVVNKSRQVELYQELRKLRT